MRCEALLVCFSYGSTSHQKHTNKLGTHPSIAQTWNPSYQMHCPIFKEKKLLLRTWKSVLLDGAHKSLRSQTQREGERERWGGIELSRPWFAQLCCQWWALITAFFLSWFKIREKEIQHSKGKTWISQLKAFNKWRWIQTGIEQSELSQSCREHEQSKCSGYVTENK